MGCLALAGAAALSLAGLPTDSEASATGTLRPLAGSCDTVVTPKSAEGVVPIILGVDVVCRMTHLGLVTGGTEREVVIPIGPPDASGRLPVSITIETITYVAANGDKLRSMFAGNGTVYPATGRAVFFGTETFIGGTGRFATATGTSQTAGEASLATGRGFLTLSGTVSY